MERELESLGHFIEGIFHHPHHEHSAGHLVGPDHTETVHASEHFEKSGLVAAHLAALHDAQMLELGLLPDSQLPDSEAPPAAPVLDEFPWKDILPLSLADMKLGKTHRRHVLHGRLCVTAYKIHDVVSEHAFAPIHHPFLFGLHPNCWEETPPHLCQTLCIG